MSGQKHEFTEEEWQMLENPWKASANRNAYRTAEKLRKLSEGAEEGSVQEAVYRAAYILAQMLLRQAEDH